MPKEFWITLFIVAVAAVAIAVIVALSVLIYKKVYYPKHFGNVYYKTVNKIVTNEDYRLINKFIFRIEENKYARIDHIIFGEKYMYLIFSRYYEGSIKGHFDDKSLIFIDKKGKKYYTENLYMYVRSIIARLCILSGLEKSMLIGIVLTNNECKNYVKSESDHLYFITKKELPKAIKSIEARDIGKLNEEQLQAAILAVSKMNRRKDD